MKVLILTVGPQGSGKTYTIKKTNLEYYSISSDNLRILYSGLFPDGHNGLSICEKDNSYIWNNLILSILENRFKLGQFTILDSTGLFNLNSITDLAKKYGYRIVAVLLQPFMNETANKIFSQLNINEKDWNSAYEFNINRGIVKVTKNAEPLFTRLEVEKEMEYLEDLIKGTQAKKD